MRKKDINNLKEMLVDFDEYSTDYTKTGCKEFGKTIKNTLKEIERLHSIIKEVREAVETGISEDNYDGCVYDIKNILDKEKDNGKR